MIKSVNTYFYCLWVILLVTGMLFAAPFYADLFFDIDWDFFPNATTLMKIHGAASILVIFLGGSIWQGHAKKKLKKSKNRISGLLILSFLSILIFTAYMLYYSGGETIRLSSSIVHTLVGTLVSLVIVFHCTPFKVFIPQKLTKKKVSVIESTSDLPFRS